MDHQFWHGKWENDQLGFHQENINSRLQKYCPQLQLQPGDQVFVPLCGKSRDMVWLAQQGFNVLGIEISEIACRDFFTENAIDVAVTDCGPFKLFSGDRIELFAGDFFDLDADHLAGVKGIYDRAALIALPEAMRKQYSEHLTRCLPENTRSLCITMCYDERKMKGPPFSVSPEEVRSLFEKHFSVEVIAESAGPEIVGNLRERGLDSLQETVFLLTN